MMKSKRSMDINRRVRKERSAINHSMRRSWPCCLRSLNQRTAAARGEGRHHLPCGIALYEVLRRCRRLHAITWPGPTTASLTGWSFGMLSWRLTLHITACPSRPVGKSVTRSAGGPPRIPLVRVMSFGDVLGCNFHKFSRIQGC